MVTHSRCSHIRSYFYALLACSSLLCCSPSDTDHSGGIAGDGQVLRMTIGGSPQTIDPHQVTGSPGLNVISALSENLLTLDYHSLELHPGVAESWQVMDDGLRYRFKLRQDAKWSNGEPVTASDFVYSWRRMLAPSLGNQYATDYYFVKNAEALHSGELKDLSTFGVVAISDYILEFQLEHRDPLFLRRLTQGQTAPVHKATVEKYGAYDDPSNPWIRSGNHVGNGAFMLVNWELNKEIAVRRNPNYWDRKNVLLSAILFNPAETESAEERLFRSGKVLLTFGKRIPVEKIASYQKQRPEQLFSQVDYATYYYLFNTQKPPFDDLNVRRAFTYSVDREMIVKHITKNNELVANALSPPSKSYSPPQTPSFDPVKAREYLQKAGYPNGEGFPKITLMYNTTDTHRKIAIAIQQMWKKELNVEVVLENQEWKVFLDSRNKGLYDISRSGSLSSIADPVDFLSMHVSGHGMNDSGWSSKSYDTLIGLSNKTTQEDKRLKLLYSAEQILLDELPILPLFYYASTYLKSPSVVGFAFNALGQPNYKGVYIKGLKQSEGAH